MEACRTCMHFDKEHSNFNEEYISCKLFYIEKQDGVSLNMEKFNCSFYAEEVYKLYDVDIVIKINQERIGSYKVKGVYAKDEKEAREIALVVLDVKTEVSLSNDN